MSLPSVALCVKCHFFFESVVPRGIWCHEFYAVMQHLIKTDGDWYDGLFATWVGMSLYHYFVPVHMILQRLALLLIAASVLGDSLFCLDYLLRFLAGRNVSWAVLPCVWFASIYEPLFWLGLELPESAISGAEALFSWEHLLDVLLYFCGAVYPVSILAIRNMMRENCRPSPMDALPVSWGLTVRKLWFYAVSRLRF